MLLNKDIKDHLLFSSAKILTLLKLSAKIHILPSIVIYPTNTCNYNCVMCPQARDKSLGGSGMELSLMEKIISDCAKLNFKPKVHFSGRGEPLVYAHIKRTMKLCKENGLIWSMTTNGFLLENYAEDFIQNKCHALNISIHGDEIAHDSTSGIKGSFKKVIAGLKKLDDLKKKYDKKNPLVAINCVFNNNNLPNIRKILDIFLQLPINSITFQHMVFLENDITKKEKFLITDNENLQKLTDLYDYVKTNKFPVKINFFPKIRKVDIRKYYLGGDSSFNKSCTVPWLTVRIYPDGDVKMCEQSFGNLKNSSLKSILNNGTAQRFRKSVRQGKFNLPYCFRCCHRTFY